MRSVILLVVVSAALAETNQSSRIVGGTDTDIEKYPYLAGLHFSWFGETWQLTCGGTIITTKTILSAANCFHGFNSPPHWRVRVGSSYPSTGGLVTTIERFIIHTSYNNLDNDVAIVRLETILTLSATIGTARIAGPGYNIPVGTEVTTMGWGRTIWAGSFSENLQEVDINIIDQQLCWERYEFLRGLSGYTHYPEVSSNMFCSGIPDRGGRGPCIGDFGGPVIINGNVVVGITSWGYGCADVWYPTVNTRISNYVTWIAAYGSA